MIISGRPGCRRRRSQEEAAWRVRNGLWIRPQGRWKTFAWDLRKVRYEAGNPTYRALAKIAGYSASTLSEAASGTRKPTLEVTLAYVGACDGDVEAWRQRWHELGETRERIEGPAADLAEPVEAATAASAEPAAVRSGRPRRRLVVAAVVTALVVVVAPVVVTVTLIRPFGSAPATAQHCPEAPAGSAFIGMAYPSGARVRTEPVLDAPVVRMIPGNCTIGFTGYCLGEKVYDASAGTPDVRWFTVAGGGVTSSAIVHGNPPPALAPTRCSNDRPVPDTIGLSVRADPTKPGAISLQASGKNIDIVGFAASYTPDTALSGARTWHQIDLVDSANSGFHAMWTPTGLGTPTSRAQVIVVAVACLGGDGPTGVTDVDAVRWHPAFQVDRPVLSRQEISTASRSACQYPHPGR